MTLAMLAVMALELASLAWTARWGHAALVVGLMAVIALPVVWRRGVLAVVPIEIQLGAVLFIFATLFLGEVRDFYERIWWWDLALHTSSGVLLGLLGFLTLYLLNESAIVRFALSPTFLACFAFCFSVTLGALWEVFEFAMDTLFATTMQKPMLGDPSGLTDTMWDLIVDGAGALLASALGLVTLRRARQAGHKDWLQRFVERHPRLFGPPPAQPDEAGAQAPDANDADPPLTV
ncbi:hypothetical protein MTR62_18920 [Novosphingobium sp. 1949]|uniref:DUF2238 domain-containing protein n=1 Tax=Novosphingobium organovorum TaxID=2930092 RepID=A0ABT0BI81_9SPHN|nr:hypothetical protein [Novosphingobium organovorum]MCJ2184745.1 hypothetical protein [Novosphingobium organovorum]